jgi:hypothetical protein
MKSTFFCIKSGGEHPDILPSQVREDVDFPTPGPIVQACDAADGTAPAGERLMSNRYLFATILAAAAIGMYLSVFVRFAQQ